MIKPALQESTRIVFSVIILLVASLLVTQPERSMKKEITSIQKMKPSKLNRSARNPSSGRSN